MYLVDDPKELIPEGRKLIKYSASVVDVGCGYRPQEWLKANIHVCVEPHPEYFKLLKKNYGNDPRFMLWGASWDVLKGTVSDYCGLVIAVDFIEHLTRTEGLAFIRLAERLATQQVALFTPWGPYPQNYDDPDKLDLKGIPGLHWQTHKSAWMPEDFPGWDIVACKEYHQHDGNGNELDKPIGAFWAVKDLT